MAIVEILAKLYRKNLLVYDDHGFEVTKGVPQGSVLSPFFFNVYLEEALCSIPVLRKCLEEGTLMAFADDLMITCQSVR